MIIVKRTRVGNSPLTCGHGAACSRPNATLIACLVWSHAATVVLATLHCTAKGTDLRGEQRMESLTNMTCRFHARMLITPLSRTRGCRSQTESMAANSRTSSPECNFLQAPRLQRLVSIQCRNGRRLSNTKDEATPYLEKARHRIEACLQLISIRALICTVKTVTCFRDRNAHNRHACQER